MSQHQADTPGHSHDAPGFDPMSGIHDKVKACMQCGTCTGSCANAFAMDLTPRQMWRAVQLGLTEDIFNCKTFWMCSACYYCTLRCPRGLPLTETIAALKRVAIAQGRFKDKRSPAFYKTFMNVVRRYGRVREMELMGRYFLSLKNPITPITFTPLGVKLMLKGKISPQMPSFSGEGKLDAIFRKVREVEANS